jgi:hypothetical protein
MPEDPKRTAPEENEPSWPPEEGFEDVTPLQGYDIHTPVDQAPEQRFDISSLPPGEQMTAGGVPLSIKKRVERGLPKDDPRAGHRQGLGADFSTGEDPITGEKEPDIPYQGAIAPKLLGDRSRTKAIIDSISLFVDKYAPLAIQSFAGYAGGSVPEGPFATSPQRRDSIKGLMSQDKVHKLLDELPTMQSDQLIDAVRILANYIWRIHAEARAELRRRATSIVAKQGVDDSDVKMGKVIDPTTNKPVKDERGRYIRDPKTGKQIERWQLSQFVDTRGELFKNTLAALSREFNEDSSRIKSDLTVLMNAVGNIARASGKGSRADAEFLEKIRQFPKHMDPDDSSSPLVQVPPRIVARPPEAPIDPSLTHLHGDYEGPRRSKATVKKNPKAQRPTRHRGPSNAWTDPDTSNQPLSSLAPPDDGDKSESFSRFLDTLLEGWIN